MEVADARQPISDQPRAQTVSGHRRASLTLGRGSQRRNHVAWYGAPGGQSESAAATCTRSPMSSARFHTHPSQNVPMDRAGWNLRLDRIRRRKTGGRRRLLSGDRATPVMDYAPLGDGNRPPRANPSSELSRPLLQSTRRAKQLCAVIQRESRTSVREGSSQSLRPAGEEALSAPLGISSLDGDRVSGDVCEATQRSG